MSSQKKTRFVCDTLCERRMMIVAMVAVCVHVVVVRTQHTGTRTVVGVHTVCSSSTFTGKIYTHAHKERIT